MDILTPTEEASAILIRILESIARLNHKTLSARTRDDVLRACELLSNTAADLDVLDDLDEPTPARQPSQVGDERFQRWRSRRAAEVEDDRLTAGRM